MAFRRVAVGIDCASAELSGRGLDARSNVLYVIVRSLLFDFNYAVRVLLYALS